LKYCHAIRACCALRCASFRREFCKRWVYSSVHFAQNVQYTRNSHFESYRKRIVMAKKKKSKVDIIAAFVAENPEATWAKASEVLASKGISPGYFASQRSKLKAGGDLGSGSGGETSATGEAGSSNQPPRRGGKPGRKPGSKPGRKPGSKPAGQTSSGLGDLADAVEFARKAGGLQAAQALLSKLESVQV